MEWHYREGDQQVGPVADQAMKALITSGAIAPSTPVWREGMEDWAQAETQFAALFATSKASGRPPPYQDTGAPLSAPTTRLVVPRNPPRSPGWMALAGAIWPGLGQMICGQVAKGAVLMVVSSIANIASGGVSSLVLCPFGGVDAYKVAKALQSGRSLPEWSFFPSVRRAGMEDWTELTTVTTPITPVMTPPHVKQRPAKTRNELAFMSRGWACAVLVLGIVLILCGMVPPGGAIAAIGFWNLVFGQN